MSLKKANYLFFNRILDENRPPAYILDINCTDPVGRSAVAIAIENENIDLLEILLNRGVEPKASHYQDKDFPEDLFYHSLEELSDMEC